MALLERVATLIRANLNDLIDKAEDPEKMIKQIILDMENQLLQVKTQVAIALADQHLLVKKEKENEDKAQEWMHKAELAVDKQKDDLAKDALGRSMSYRQLAESFLEQVEDQKVQAENLKSALQKLEQKLLEAQSKREMLIARHRRARAMGKATDARIAIGAGSKAAAFDRMKSKVMYSEAVSQAKAELVADDLDDKMAALEKEDKIDRLLTEIKNRRRLNPWTKRDKEEILKRWLAASIEVALLAGLPLAAMAMAGETETDAAEELASSQVARIGTGNYSESWDLAAQLLKEHVMKEQWWGAESRLRKVGLSCGGVA